MSDWADEKAKEFCGKRWPSQRVEAYDLAALLREVTSEALANAALLDQAATDYRKSRDEAEAKLANSEEECRWLEAQIRDLEAKLAKLLEQVASEATQRERLKDDRPCWLIEAPAGAWGWESVHWWCGQQENGAEWTDDVNLAARFVRRKDAEVTLNFLNDQLIEVGGGVRVVEHIWIG